MEARLENYAMGWEATRYSGTPVIWHDGAFDNFESVIGFMPDLDAGSVLLANSETAESLMNDAPGFLDNLIAKITPAPPTSTPSAATATETRVAATPSLTDARPPPRSIIWLPVARRGWRSGGADRTVR